MEHDNDNKEQQLRSLFLRTVCFCFKKKLKPFVHEFNINPPTKRRRTCKTDDEKWNIVDQHKKLLSDREIPGGVPADSELKNKEKMNKRN